jgi:hypothetical protein
LQPIRVLDQRHPMRGSTVITKLSRLHANPLPTEKKTIFCWPKKAVLVGILAACTRSDEGRAFAWICRTLLYFLMTEWVVWIVFHLIPDIALGSEVMQFIAFVAALTFCFPICAHAVISGCSAFSHVKNAIGKHDEHNSAKSVSEAKSPTQSSNRGNPNQA